jgi:hypothetical protein
VSLEEVTYFWIECDRCKKNTYGCGDDYEDEHELVDDSADAGWKEIEGVDCCPKCQTPTEKKFSVDLTGIQSIYGLNEEEFGILLGQESEDKKALLRDRPTLIHALEDIEREIG